MKIGIVGPCGAGKSTLASQLAPLGYHVRQIAQEHSYVPDMWQRIGRVDILIYLTVSFENTVIRRQLNWRITDYEEQLRRLQHAYAHADCIIDTNSLRPDEVSELVMQFLNQRIKP